MRTNGEKWEQVDNWFFGLLVAAIIVVIGCIIFGFWTALKRERGPTFELNKAEWVCTKSETGLRTQPMLVGKVVILMPVNNTECIEYHRNPTKE